MLTIDEEKLPPPNPAVAAQASSTQSWASWACSASQPLGTTMASSSTGMNSSDALITVHARPAEAGHGERVGDAEERPDQVGDRRQQEQLRHRQGDADVGQVDDDDRPEHPDAEAHVLGEDREDQVLASRSASRSSPRRSGPPAPSARSSGPAADVGSPGAGRGHGRSRSCSTSPPGGCLGAGSRYRPSSGNLRVDLFGTVSCRSAVDDSSLTRSAVSVVRSRSRSDPGGRRRVSRWRR